jgi:hypothetical protein
VLYLDDQLIRSMTNRTFPLSHRVTVLCALVGLFCCSACTAGTPKPIVDQRGLVHVAAKKGGSGVRVAYRIEGVPQANVPTTVTVEFSGISAPDGAIASFSAEDPAVLTGVSTLPLKPKQTQSTSVFVTAAEDGVYFLNVTTTQAGRSSVISIPVKVGTGAPKLEKQGTAETTPSGERVISLPPTERR